LKARYNLIVLKVLLSPSQSVTRSVDTMALPLFVGADRGPNSTWLVSTRHVRLCRASRASRDERVDEQAIVLACTSLVVFMLLHTQILFVPSNKIN